MSWESVNSMPSNQSEGSPYKSLAAPIVAERGTATPAERVRLFFRSTPELPSKRAARRVVLTPSHLYAERMDGAVQRVHLDALQGRRVDGPLVVYGVTAGEDLALLRRSGCPVTRALDARFRDTQASALEPLVFHERRAVALGSALALGTTGALMIDHYGFDFALELYRRGHVVAETQLGVYAGVAVLLVALGALLFMPWRWEIDTLGVRRVRGLPPWLHYLDPPDAFGSVRVDPRLTSGSAPVQGTLGYDVTLARKGPERRRDLLVKHFPASPPNVLEDTRGDARAFATRVAALLALELDVRS